MRNYFLLQKNHQTYDYAVYVSMHEKIELDSSKCVALVLSPQFYWVKYVSLPVQTETNANKLAASIFEGYLPQGDYKYLSIKAKKEGKFILLAYNEKKIYDFLASSVNSLEAIHGIYFAQNEFINLEDTLSTDKYKIFKLNEIIVQIPHTNLEVFEDVNHYLQDKEILSKSKYKIQLSALKKQEVSRKTVIMTLVVATMFFLAHIYEGFFYFLETNKLKTKKEYIYKESNLPKTSFELKSIKKRLLSIDKEQSKIRDIFTTIQHMPLSKNMRLQELDINKEKIEVSIALNSSEKGASVIDYLSKKYSIISQSVDKKHLLLKLNYETK